MDIASIGAALYITLSAAAADFSDRQTLDVLRSGNGAEATAAFNKPGRYVIKGAPPAGSLPQLHLDKGARPAWGKAILNLEAGYYDISRLHLDGCAVRESNCAGIRINPASSGAYLHRLLITGNENGILSSEGEYEYELADSILDGNGKASDPGRQGYSHNLYANNNKRVVLNRVSSLNSAFGHNIKSRARITELNQVLSQNAVGGRELDVPNGGIVRVKDSRFIKLADDGRGGGQNNLVDIGIEGINDGRPEECVFENVEFHNDFDPARNVEYLNNHGSKECVLIDPLFTGRIKDKDRAQTLKGKIRIVYTGGVLGPRVAAGGNPATATAKQTPAAPSAGPDKGAAQGARK